MAKPLDRRSFVKNVAAGTAAAVAVTTVGVGAAKASPSLLQEGLPQTWVHEKLKAGVSLLGPWEVRAVSPIFAGGIPVLLQNTETQEVVRVDICGRGPSEGPVEHTDHFSLYLMNAGTGDKPTERDYHLPVRALAFYLGREEGPALALLPHAQRLESFGAVKVSANPF